MEISGDLWSVVSAVAGDFRGSCDRLEERNEYQSTPEWRDGISEGRELSSVESVGSVFVSYGQSDEKTGTALFQWERKHALGQLGDQREVLRAISDRHLSNKIIKNIK